MSDFDEQDRLTRELHDRSHDVGGHPIGLESVKQNARTIQRRRRLVSGVAAAAAVAVVVPTAMAVTNGLVQGAQGPVDQPTPGLTEPVDPSPDVDDTRNRDHQLTTVGLQRGDAPAIAYLNGPSLVQPEGEVSLGARYQGITQYDEGWIAVGADSNGDWATYFLDPDGSVRSDEPVADAFTVSPDGSLVAYTTPDGRLMVDWDGLSAPAQLNDPDAGQMSPVAVFGEDSCDESEGEGGCVVFYNTAGAQPKAFLSSHNGIVERAGPFRALSDVSGDRLAGQISSSLTGSCSAVTDQSFTEQWRTCDFRLRRFSPDGRYILGTNAYGDGFADTELAILDAQTGEPVVRYDGKGKSFVGILDMVWEDDSHALAVTYEEGTWMVVRLDTEGNVEQAVGGFEADDMSRPYFLATQP
jgi:YD repeat-containing protein